MLFLITIKFHSMENTKSSLSSLHSQDVMYVALSALRSSTLKAARVANYLVNRYSIINPDNISIGFKVARGAVGLALRSCERRVALRVCGLG